MGIGAGIVLLAIGAVLSWAVEVDLPYVDDDALGGILLAVGVTLLVVGVVLNASRRQGGPDDVAPGLGLLAAGAVLVWGLEVDLPYVYDAALGAILMAGGVVAIGATVFLHQQSRRTRRVVQQR